MKTEWKKYIKAGITVFVLFLLMYYWKSIEGIGSVVLYAALPISVGFVIAYLINLPMSFFERILFGKCRKGFLLKIKRPVCILLAITSLAAILFLIVKLIVPELILCIELLIDELTPIVENIYSDLESKYQISKYFEKALNIKPGENADLRALIEKAIGAFASGVSSVMGSVVSVLTSIFSKIFTVFMSFVFALYLLAEKEKLYRQTVLLSRTYIKNSIRKKAHKLLSVANDCFHKFIVGQCIEAILLGVLCILGMMIFRFPYATMIGTLIGFTALIPVAGAYIGAAIGAFMVFTAGSFIQTILFIVFIILLQQLEGNLIYPKVVGASIGLPGIWVLAAITIGGAVMGIPGMLISVPLAATAYKLLKTDITKKNADPENQAIITAGEQSENAETQKPSAN